MLIPGVSRGGGGGGGLGAARIDLCITKYNDNNNSNDINNGKLMIIF